MATLTVQSAQPGLVPSSSYLHTTSPNGSSTGTNRDEPYINSMSPSPVPLHGSNHVGPMLGMQYDGGMPRMSNAGRRASSPAALYQQGQMMSFAAPSNMYSNGNGYGQPTVAPPAGTNSLSTFLVDRPPLPNHSLSHSVGPSVPMWQQGTASMQGRATQNGMNASSFRRGSLGGHLATQQEHAASGYINNDVHPTLDFHHQFHHSTMYDTYQVHLPFFRCRSHYDVAENICLIQVKHRKRTSPEQLSVLEKSFDENCKPSAVTRKLLADQIGMTPRSVQVWFQNR